jgi:predicted Zn finger-like uncharacterized protein
MIGCRLSKPAAMIITCPNCQTKYQVADQAIGAAGRKVQCANCHRSWKAIGQLEDRPPKPRIVAGTDTDLPEPQSAPAPVNSDRLFAGDGETELDRAFAEEEERLQPKSALFDEPDPEVAVSAADEPGAGGEEEKGIDHRLLSRRRRDLARRQKKHASRLPLARVRRIIRMTSLVALMTLLGMAYQFRVDIVRAYPDLGGLYASLGLPVNIYGLTFSDVETLRTLKDGADVTIITARIRSIVGNTVRVPPILVSILNAENEPIYEWTARAPVENISPGDVVAFETQLTSAPSDAAQVRLAFGTATVAAAEQAGP